MTPTATSKLLKLGVTGISNTYPTQFSKLSLRGDFSKVEEVKNSLGKSGRFRTSGSTFCSRRTRNRFYSDLNGCKPLSGRTGKGLGGRQASPDYEPPFSNAKPGISDGLFVFLQEHVVKLMLFMFSYIPYNSYLK